MPWVTLAPAAHHAVLNNETSSSNCLARALAVEQGRGDAARDVHPADGVSERRNALGQGTAQFLGGQCVAHAAARPEGGAVEATGVALASLVAVGAAAGVDDVRVDRADVLDVELVLLALRGHVVGQEDVGGLGDLVQHLLPARRGHVDADAALSAVGMLDQRMPLRVQLEAAHVDEAALGVAAHRVLHLDDVGAPVGEDGPRRGDEGELRNLEDPHALHHLDQVNPPGARARTTHTYCNGYSCSPETEGPARLQVGDLSHGHRFGNVSLHDARPRRRQRHITSDTLMKPNCVKFRYGVADPTICSSRSASLGTVVVGVDDVLHVDFGCVWSCRPESPGSASRCCPRPIRCSCRRSGRRRGGWCRCPSSRTSPCGAPTTVVPGVAVVQRDVDRVARLTSPGRASRGTRPADCGPEPPSSGTIGSRPPPPCGRDGRTTGVEAGVGGEEI